MEYNIDNIDVSKTEKALHKATKIAIYTIYDNYHCIIDNDEISSENIEDVYKAIKTLHLVGCMTTGRSA